MSFHLVCIHTSAMSIENIMTVTEQDLLHPKVRGTCNESFHILDIEIDDRGVAVCQTGICEPHSEGIKLLHYSEIPHFLKGNPWVVHGYRAFLPFGQCMRSLLTWNNETINIWSHLLGFLLFLELMLYDNLIVIPRLKGDIVDHVVVSIGLICYQFCLACSAGYHIFSCHSERACRRWLQADLTGISIGIIGCYIPAVYYGFYCVAKWRDTYMVVVTVLTMSTLWLQFHPRFLSPWCHYPRIATYIGLVAYGIIPSLHWVYLSGGSSSPIVQLFVPKVTTMYLMGILAFTFYISKFPERICPGVFDYIGSSHQCWHVVVVAAMLWWRAAVLQIAHYRSASDTCDTL
ncbi:progestin and adipoQ receptor family member 3-like [Babylonia areolata]|uniref:progestin and adipoQ receptor family member 3-like n=1 Tax=Babylonia areolata TaxID=304850 RepID=UPI003FD3BCEE